MQSNYAGDFRSILRCVFVLNATQDEPDVVDGPDCVEPSEANEAPAVAGANGGIDLPLHAEQVIPPVDLATDALHHELGRELYDQHLRQRGRRYEEFSNDDEHEEDSATSSQAGSVPRAASNTEEPHGAVYGQNLGLHVSGEQLVHEFSMPPSNEFYQPEPALLDIASGGGEDASTNRSSSSGSSLQSVSPLDGACSVAGVRCNRKSNTEFAVEPELRDGLVAPSLHQETISVIQKDKTRKHPSLRKRTSSTSTAIICWL